jgi:hypothetical protein
MKPLAGGEGERREKGREKGKEEVFCILVSIVKG